MKSILFSVAVLCVPAIATAGSAAPASGNSITTVEELSVMPSAQCLQPKKEPGSAPPRIVSSYPSQGATVRPGLLVLRVTFDAPMSCRGFFSPGSGTGGGQTQLRSPCPELRQRWVLSFDRRTIRTVCHAEAEQQYAVWPSSEAQSTFVSLDDQPLERYQLSFSTSAAAPTATVSNSLIEDRTAPDAKPPADVPLPLQQHHFKR